MKGVFPSRCAMKPKEKPDEKPEDTKPDIPFVRRGWFVYPIAAIVVVGFIILLLARTIFVVVKPGEIGVLYDLLFGGTQTTKVYTEGLVVKLPWNQFFHYDTRLQALKTEIQPLSREGMQVHV